MQVRPMTATNAIDPSPPPQASDLPPELSALIEAAIARAAGRTTPTAPTVYRSVPEASSLRLPQLTDYGRFAPADGRRSDADGRSMDGPGASDRGVPAQGQDRTKGFAPHALGDRLAASERGQVARHPGGAGAVVAGGSDPGSSPGQALPPLGPPGCLGEAAAPRPRAWGPTRDDLSGRHQHPGPPQGGGRGKKGASSKQRDEREALGRSRGGYGTKACVIADGLGRAVAFILAPGQAHELPQAIPLLERLPGVPKWVVADRGLSSHAFREHIWSLSSSSMVGQQMAVSF